MKVIVEIKTKESFNASCDDTGNGLNHVVAGIQNRNAKLFTSSPKYISPMKGIMYNEWAMMNDVKNTIFSF